MGASGALGSKQELNKRSCIMEKSLEDLEGPYQLSK